MTLSANELRQSFLEYFSERGHATVPSAPLIPQADPTLLFTNAGMNQFKRVFLGEETRDYVRAASVQKCMRAGGKHNDLENVGFTNRHHTFFEMLGNFSFGDYFKEEAIVYGWEFLTNVVELPADRLWVTVYREDDEAFDLWQRRMKVPESRIIRLGEKDNFWQMGDTGPCGPCSEIHLDQGEALGCGRATCGVGCDCDRYLEIWNLVFMQFDRDASGTLHPLPKPSIDTGMGLERLAAVSQGVLSNFDTDLFSPIFQAIGNRTKRSYGKDIAVDRSMRVIADHLRAMTFLITDGILPSNEGRGYVLRRILRRASRHGRLLGCTEPFLHELTDTVIQGMKSAYPALAQGSSIVVEVVQREEERFIGTLEQGTPILDKLVQEAKAKGHHILEGEAVFKLYDTYGFPLDLVEDAAREEQLQLDREGYQRALAVQRERARKAAIFAAAESKPYIRRLKEIASPTTFVGYTGCEGEGALQAIVKDEHVVEQALQGEKVDLVLQTTPFYPEGGGQVGDQGSLLAPNGRVNILSTTKTDGGFFLHHGAVAEGRINVGDSMQAHVNVSSRKDAARNHTATHLLHAALRELLGPHVKQYGSLVAPNRLRFDFAHFKPLSPRDIDDIEALVNEQIRSNTAVQTKVMGIQEAIDDGALAFFGDKYGTEVRVVGVGTFSKELCGGTHCTHTGEIGIFRIVSEGGISAGVRRIEALTGVGALNYTKQIEGQLRELSEVMRVSPNDLLTKTQKTLTTLKETERELEQLKMKLAAKELDQAKVDVRTIHAIPVQTQRVDGLSMPELRALSDRIRHTVPSGILVLGSALDTKVSLLVIVSKDLTKKIRAGDIAKAIATDVNGSGGGRPDMAQAGGTHPEGLPKALARVFEYVEEQQQNLT
ncbi:MAG: alanine--tRNA ligase [Nitrospirales bacterium]|nr:alanine--tRNA ligase [Nitrospira sp.]MDR4502847.1 alanine--tRNA ligase [Nitrospirales bacterium]